MDKLNIGIRRGGKYANGVVPNIGIRPGGKYANGGVPYTEAPLVQPPDTNGVAPPNTEQYAAPAPAATQPTVPVAVAPNQNPPTIGGFVKSLFKPEITAATASGVAPQPSANTAPPIVAPAVAAVTENTGLTGQAATALQQRNAANRESLNYADGTANVPGPAGIDKVHGVSLTKGESVLPADTTAAIGSENIAKLIQATHTPIRVGTAPRFGIKRGGKYADGTVPINTDTLLAQRAASQRAREAQAETPFSAPDKPGFDTGVPISPEASARIDALYGKGTPALGVVQPPAAASPAPTPAPTTASTGSTVPSSANGEPISPSTTYVSPSNIGINRPAPLPKFGDQGEGFVRNDRTGATTRFNAPPPAPAAQPTQGGDDQLSRIRAAAESRIASAGSETMLRQQEASQKEQMQAIQQEMLQPGITDKRKAQLAEALHGMRGAGDVWMPYQAKDAMGMPTGEMTLYNRVTGDSKPMGGTGSQPGSAASGAPQKIMTADDLAKLPAGTRYTAPDGSIRIKS